MANSLESPGLKVLSAFFGFGGFTTPVQLLRTVFRYTLNNVVFGIMLMVLIALYIAIGSGLPGVREHFEMNELEFFDTWVLKGLMLLLCLSLSVVTWNRIPLTPPRYGVWCIHAGIITLILGTSLYYHLKVEGRTLVLVNHSAVKFYDTSERALYARVPNENVIGMQPLPSLPRFNTYDPDHRGAAMGRADLHDIDHLLPVSGPDAHAVELSQLLGLPNKVSIDVIGFYPYAEIMHDLEDDASSGNVGVAIHLNAAHGNAQDSNTEVTMLTSADPSVTRQVFGSTEIEHRNVGQADLPAIKDMAKKLFTLTVKRGDKPAEILDIELAKTYSPKDSGYSLTAQSFNPSFPMFGTHEVVSALTIHVVSQSPASQREFWRMILLDKDIQTDFKLDPATTPPMVKGNRQKEPIDKSLLLSFHVNDPLNLLPGQGEKKHTLITAGETALVDIFTGFDSAAEVKDLPGGGQIPIFLDGASIMADVLRDNHVKVTTRVQETVEARRQKDLAESGQKQVLLVKVTSGKWSQDVFVPFNLYPLPDADNGQSMEPWEMGTVKIPGAIGTLQLQLGNLAMPMPVKLSLKSFEMVHYPGGQGENGPFRDFISTMELQTPDGERIVDTASLNSPIYYDGGRWLFFQAGYDPKGQWSIIGVGNRPGVVIMIAGCVMIVSGLLYAFYIKPLVIRRMKQNALARAAIKKPRSQTIEMVESK